MPGRDFFVCTVSVEIAESSLLNHFEMEKWLGSSDTDLSLYVLHCIYSSTMTSYQNCDPLQNTTCLQLIILLHVKVQSYCQLAIQHLAQFSVLLILSENPVGKRLDFNTLIQSLIHIMQLYMRQEVDFYKLVLIQCNLF